MTAVLVGWYPVHLQQTQSHRLSPSSCSQVLYVFLDTISGYISARLYKSKPTVCSIQSTCTPGAVSGCVEFVLHALKPVSVHFSPLPPVMGGVRWKSNVLMTSFFVPGYVRTPIMTYTQCYNYPSLSLPCFDQGGVCCVLRSKLHALGCGILGCHSLYHLACPPLPLVWYLPPSYLLWLLPWVQEACEFSRVICMCIGKSQQRGGDVLHVKCTSTSK